MGFGHIGLIVILFLVALVVFGPRRMIEMVAQLGKSLIETRDALRQMNWSVTSDEDEAQATTGAERARDHLHVVESAPVAEPHEDE